MEDRMPKIVLNGINDVSNLSLSHPIDNFECLLSPKSLDNNINNEILDLKDSTQVNNLMNNETVMPKKKIFLKGEALMCHEALNGKVEIYLEKTRRKSIACKLPSATNCISTNKNENNSSLPGVSNKNVTVPVKITRRSIAVSLANVDTIVKRGRKKSVKRTLKNGINPSESTNEKNKRRKQLNTTEDEYEIECIVDHSVTEIGKINRYLIKWVGWDEPTWEPIEVVKECYEHIANYFHKKIYPNIPTLSNNGFFQVLKSELDNHTQLEIDNICRLNFTSTGHTLPAINAEELDDLINILSKIPPYARDNQFVKKIKNQLLILKVKEARIKQVKVMLQWESSINSVITDSPLVKVFNSVDLDYPPANFTYVNKYVSGCNITLPEDPPLGCECNTCYKSCSCCQLGSGLKSYKDGFVLVPKGTPIYECNKKCKCPPTCQNRVVQNGTKIPFAIFKTSNGCGWGLKTLRKIQKGEFVCEYTGEVITSSEAERRGRYYDKNGSTYLFDLDFNDKDKFPYTVDAAYYGNVSHFINHSCNPNLEVYAVWVDCLDPNLPRLALFARKTIKENEELTFDYLCLPTTTKEKTPQGQQKDICKCGEDICRKYLF